MSGAEKRDVLEDITPYSGVLIDNDGSGFEGVYLEGIVRARIQSLTERLEKAERELREWEEREASVCPEDVGFVWYVAWLRARLTEAERERAEVVEEHARIHRDMETNCVALADNLALEAEIGQLRTRLAELEGRVTDEVVDTLLSSYHGDAWWTGKRSVDDRVDARKRMRRALTAALPHLSPSEPGHSAWLVVESGSSLKRCPECAATALGRCAGPR